ncbi:unnamed protein product [Debaryomyces tyrocola]|nr:unnamed protein product [Debaryomyces tyrocola]
MYSNSSKGEKPKKRIRVACDSCRRKKIKCDGQYPCGNCQQSNGSGCNYKERQEKRTKSPKISKNVSNSKTIEILNTRLSKLEDVILNLAEKLDPRSGNITKPHAKRETSEREEYEDEKDEEDEADDDDLTSIEDGNEELTTEGDEGEQGRNSDNKDRDTSNKKWNYTPQRLEQFFGTHSVVCLFSDKSLGWIESALGPEDSRLINPIRNLPFVFYMKSKSFILKWVDPPLIDIAKKKKLLEAPFPKDYRLVFDLLDNYYDLYAATNYICDIDWVRSLFEIYYGIDGKKRRKFKCSELIIMSMVICLCISSKIDEDTSGLNMSPASSCSANTPKSIQSMNNDQFTVLQEELFDNCVFYYHRILVINDGIETIQAIILLVTYIESSYILSHVSYMLISVAIRFAQEIGIHRQESYANLSAQEAKTRRMIWWCCYCFDMEICFRSGKPPLINGLDISVGSENDFLSCSDARTHKDQKLNGFDQTEKFISLVYYHFLLLTRIRAKSYNSLFVASAGTESFESLLVTLAALNRETFKLADLMDPILKPRFYNDPEFCNVYSSDSRHTKNILCIHFTYFSHLMVTNRIPFLIGIPDSEQNDERSLSFRNIFLDSARTILAMAKNMPRESTGLSFYNWVVFFPSAAFMSLLAACINHPTAPGTYDDIKLLADSCMNFFSHKKTWPVEGFSRFKVYQSKEATVDLIIKVLLKIVIRVFETKTGIPVLANNKLLKEHLESTEKQFPDIFKETGDFISQFATSMKSSSFGTQGFVAVCGTSPFPSKNKYDKSPKDASYNGESNQDLTGKERSNGQNYELSNNMSPGFSNMLHPSVNANDFFMNDDLISDYLNDDGLTSIINSQMNNLPNFFFDNNLGL